jgi:hypothetical protein
LEPHPKKTTETTPAVLAAAIDAAVDRYFGDLDESEEAVRLGIDEAVIGDLHDGLLELRSVAQRAGDAGAGGASR